MKKDAPVLSVVLNWNGGGMLSETVRDLLAQTVKNHHVLVIDNGSTDNSMQLLPDDSNLSKLMLPSNIGFSRGNNAVLNWDGWKEVDWKSGWLFISNNDVYYPDDAIAKLRAAAEQNSDCHAISPVIAYADRPDLIWFGGSIVNEKIGMIRHRGIKRSVSHMCDRRIEQIPYATGCSLLMRAESYFALAGFNPAFPHYGEDVDLSFRLTRVLRGQIYLLRETLAFHKVSMSLGSSPIKYRWRTAGLVRLWRVHFGAGWWRLRIAFMFSILTALKSNGMDGVRAMLAGWKDGMSDSDLFESWERTK